MAVFAENDSGCEWKTFEETDTYIMENCVTEDGYSARVRQKPVEGLNIEIVEAPKKKANPIQEFKEKVAESEQATAKVEKIEKIEQEVIVTEKKIEKLKVEKAVKEKQKIEAKENKTVDIKVEEKIEQAIEGKKLAETPVKDTEKPIVKDEIAKKEEDKKADDKLVEEATEKEWAEVDAEQKIDWMQLHEMLPRLIVENEKVKAGELDYESAVDTL